jgi:hypothetical protein
MKTSTKWLLRLSLTALAVLLTNDSGRPKPKKPAV